MKKGILIVSFGCTYKEERENNIDRLVADISEKYPEVTCYQAFSSNIIRRILKERDFIVVPDVAEALMQMKEDGITQVYIQPTHILDGVENNKVKDISGKYMKYFEEIKIGVPLLDSEDDIQDVANSLWKELKAVVREDILILMGHGTKHQANSVYEKLEKQFTTLGNHKVFISTVEGIPLIEDVIEKLDIRYGKNAINRRIVLAPFMLVAGDHARNDMAGEKDSYVSKLIQAGYRPECIMKGIGEYEGIRNIYIRHLDKIMNSTN